MSLTQADVVRILGHTVFRPGWRIGARAARPHPDHVLVTLEVLTVDSSFVTRGGEYTVPLVERSRYRISASDYQTPQELLFRVLSLARDLQLHEDREFLRTWDEGRERWAAPFHSHTAEGDDTWTRVSALPVPVAVLETGSDPCNEIDDGSGPCSEHHAMARVVAAQCDNEDDRGDCWESGA